MKKDEKGKNTFLTAPEERSLEYKENVSDYRSIIKTAVSFLNDIGGRIIIGVEDKTLKVTGLTQVDLENHIERIPQSLYDAISPTCRPIVRSMNIDGKQLIEISISAGTNKPYYITAEGKENGTFIRVGAHTKKANTLFIKELEREGLRKSFDSEPVLEFAKNITEEPLLASFYNTKTPTLEQLMADKVIVQEPLTSQAYLSIAGLIYFGHNPQDHLTGCEILLTKYPTNKKDSNIFLTKDFNGPLESLLEFVQAEISKDLVSEQEIKGLKLENLKYEIPPAAIRESLLNALIHRRYDLPEAIKVNIFSDRVEIMSPGNFPGPIIDFLSGVSYSRNPILRQLARKRGLVEKRGLGFGIIFNSCESNGNPKPKIEEKELSVIVTLYRSRERISVHQLPDKLKPLESLRTNRTSFQTSQATILLSVNRNTARSWLTELEENGVIKSTGHGRGAKWEWLV